MLDKSTQFLSSEQPSELKSLDLALNIAGVEKYAKKIEFFVLTAILRLRKI